MPTILHTCDLHFGARLGFLGYEGAERHRKRMKETFHRLIDLVQEENYDLLLIAGDLFDTPRPPETVVDLVLAELARARVPVCILPGNHDYYGERSVYNLREFPANVTILTDKVTSLRLPALDLCLYGRAATSKTDRTSPLQDLKPTCEARWHVAMAHGNLVRADLPPADRPIDPGEIARSGMHYVALGDWHGYLDCSAEGVAACYAGAPEPMALDQERTGYVVAVEITEAGVTITPKRVGTVQVRQVEFDLTGRTMEDVLQQLLQEASADTMLSVVLTGLAEAGQLADEEALAEQLSPFYHHVQIRDRSHPAADVLRGSLPGGPVLHKFVALMSERLQQAATDDDRELAERALQLGVAMLQGKKVF